LKVPSWSSDSVIIETICADVYGRRRQRNFGQHVMRQLKSMGPVMNLVFSMDDPSFCGGKKLGYMGKSRGSRTVGFSPALSRMHGCAASCPLIGLFASWTSGRLHQTRPESPSTFRT
jgi:hypothetical protein